ncbi:MAG: hypothetical protein ACFNUO_01310 [Capnocytophaga ochracea]
MRCIDNIKDITLDCDYKPKKGLKHRVLVIPYKDIDRRYTTLNADKTEITHLQLLPSKRGFLFELNNAFKVSGSQKFSGGFAHELSIKIDKADSGNIATMNALTKGTYVLVVETTGNTFEVLGYEAGLVVNSAQRDYAGNVIGLTLATPSDVKELRMVALWGEGDYLTMSKKFERKAFVGKNLVLKSKERKKITPTSPGWIIDYYLSVNLEEGETYVLTYKNYGQTFLPILWSDSNSWDNAQEIFNGKPFKAKENYKMLRLHTTELNKLCDFELIKLEKGDTPTDWCPANED